MAAQFVKPYVKTNKNDQADAEAICEAVTRPNMRFVPIRTVEQQDIAAIISSVGIILGAVYMLKLYKEVMLGQITNNQVISFKDLYLYEILAIMLLASK
ncbi:hypothetical protein TNCT_555971 [Trichonephila clavata]|uniref:Transposase n=1 Tax=Trichonephila clavata TaxID=2740835 RepID=A0A8X6FY26_TRICU|nr:hypothetical protein TNCT_555971 [Trichonephila clavata]